MITLGNSVRDKMWDYVYDSIWVSTHKLVKESLPTSNDDSISISVFNSTTMLINNMVRFEITLWEER